MNELERLVVLLVQLGLGQVILQDVQDELIALAETVAARCRSAEDYHKTFRGVDALERARARAEQREPDYGAARKKAGLLTLG